MQAGKRGMMFVQFVSKSRSKNGLAGNGKSRLYKLQHQSFSSLAGTLIFVTGTGTGTSPKTSIVRHHEFLIDSKHTSVAKILRIKENAVPCIIKLSPVYPMKLKNKCASPTTRAPVKEQKVLPRQTGAPTLQGIETCI